MLPTTEQINSNNTTENYQNPEVIKTFKIVSEKHNHGIGSTNPLWDYEEILNKLGFGKAQWILLLSSGLVTMTSMSTLFSVGIISISSQCEFGITQQEKGIMMAACMTGIVLSTYIWGCLSDVWGRHKVLICSVFMANFLQVILIFITNIWFYNITNLLIGVSLGGVLGAIFPYLCELNPAKYRSIVINYSSMFVSLTVIYVPAFSWLVLSSNWSLQLWGSFVVKPWRLIILLNMLPGFFGGLLLLSLPESPKLLLAQNKQEKALKALQWLAKLNTGNDLQTVLNTSEIHIKPEEITHGKLLNGLSVLLSMWTVTKPLFLAPHGFNVVKAVIAFAGMIFASGGLQVWFPEIINKSVESSSWGNGSNLCEVLNDSYTHDLHKDIDKTICSDFISHQTYINNIIMGLAYLMGFFIQGLLLRYFSLKSILVSSMALAGICGILLNFISYSIGIIILLCLYILLPGLGVSIMCGVLVELVPVYLRSKTISVAFTLGRLGSIISTNMIAVMLRPYCSSLLAILTSVVFASGGIIYYLPI